MTYTISIEKDLGNTIKTLETLSFDTLKLARKNIKPMIKKYNLERHAGHVVNYSTQMELWTNF